MSFNDLENSDYWELMNVLNSKRDDKEQKSEPKPDGQVSAYDFFKSL